MILKLNQFEHIEPMKLLQFCKGLLELVASREVLEETESGCGTGGGICIVLYCHHQNDSCTEMGSFHLLWRNKVTVRYITVSTNNNFEEKGMKQNQATIHLLTGYQPNVQSTIFTFCINLLCTKKRKLLI